MTKTLTETCVTCKKTLPLDAGDYRTIETAKQTWGSPAEYDDVFVCDRCVDYAEYLADPETEAYERARANGWGD